MMIRPIVLCARNPSKYGVRERGRADVRNDPVVQGVGHVNAKLLNGALQIPTGRRAANERLGLGGDRSTDGANTN